MTNVLVLNASYEVLNVTRWQRALGLIFSGKAEVLEITGQFLHSPSLTIEMPSVIRMNYYVRKPRLIIPLTRSNVLMRDKYTCQYCHVVKNPSELTLDHVLPRSLGGDSSWDNLVAACKRCNSRKGNRTPETAGMLLRKTPRAPLYIPSIQVNNHENWKKYVFYATPQVSVAGATH